MAAEALSIPELSDLSKALECPEKIASGSADVLESALRATKYIFDVSLKSEESSKKHINDLLVSIAPSEAPQTRSQSRRKRSRQDSPAPIQTLFDSTPLSSLFTANVDEDQIWAQLDLRTKHICDLLNAVLDSEGPEEGDEEELRKTLAAEGIEFDDFDDSDPESEEEEDGNDEDLDDAFDEDEGEEEYEHGEEEEGVMDLDNSLDGGEDDEGEGGENESQDSTGKGLPNLALPRRRKKGASELDDGFFDLSSFKAEVERAEARSSSKGRLAEDDDSDEDSVDFDMFAPLDTMGEMQEENESQELFYSDFFEPPRSAKSAGKKTDGLPTKAGRVRFHDEVRVKKIRPSGKNRPLHEEASFGEMGENGSDSDQEFNDVVEGDDTSNSESGDSSSDGNASEEGNETRETIERLKDDLFADEEEDDSEKDMTTHQKRVAALREQIEGLESENVSQKHWTLMGEADSRARPQNSLLEEDLEFERAMKAVPVITEEKVQSLEELIKARILENRFDDVVRIRPFEDKPFLPSRILELHDSKSTQSLAQIYENEYNDAQNGGSQVDDRDGKLKKEHDEIEHLWEKICGKLDALSNAYFVPKQPKSIISSVTSVSTATLESALPTTRSAESMLAPEEIFAAETSNPRARSELTPAEKRASRAKERKAKRKQRDLLDKTVDKVAKVKGIGGVKRQKQAALENIVKHGKGVTVVGKAAKDLKTRSKGRSKKS